MVRGGLGLGRGRRVLYYAKTGFLAGGDPPSAGFPGALAPLAPECQSSRGQRLQSPEVSPCYARRNGDPTGG